jgi:hypothetical protein
VKALAAVVSGAALAVSVWLVWLSRRPVELNPYDTSADLGRVTALAIAIGILTAAVVWMAARRGFPWTSWIWIGAAGVLTVIGAGRRPELPAWMVIVTNAAWLAGAAAVAAAIVATPRFANVPRRASALLLALVAVAGVAAAIWGGGSGLGSTMGVTSAATGVDEDSPPPPTDVPAAGRVVLAVHLVLLIVAVTWIAARWWRGRDTATGLTAALREPLVICGALWFTATVIERVVHLMPLDSYRNVYLGAYSDWSVVTAVHIPLIAVGAVIGSIGWSIAVKPHVERLPSGTFVLPDSDPITMLRKDLADWVGDPTLQLAFADGAGRWIAPSGEVHLEDLRYDRASTVVTRNGRPIGVLDHDIALSTAPDALHTAAALSGLAFDANQLLAVSEGRLAEARRLGERLLGADIAMRAEVEELLGDGPIRRLQSCADNLAFGAPISSVVGSIQQATAEVRQLSHGLYPPELIEGGLGAVVGDRRGAPHRRLPAAVEVTAFRLVTDDPTGWFEDEGTVLRIHVRRQTIDPSVLDRIDVLGGTVSNDVVELPLDVEPAPED